MVSKSNKLLVTLGICISLSMSAFAGDITPPNAPDTNSMFTLESLYQRLMDGTPGSMQNGFANPLAGPGSTMHSINQIMEKMPAQDANGADPAHVLKDKTYWGLTSGNWGKKTGDMTNVGAQNVTPGTTNVTISQGYHDGTGSVTGDADLVSGNIRAGVNMFGVAGNSNVVDTSSGDVTAANISWGKKAWSNGSEITGTLIGGKVCPGGELSPGGRWWRSALGAIGDGTVTDTTTGLVWYYRGNNFWGTYASSTAYISNHRTGLDGLNDGSSNYTWRMPTMREMLYITNPAYPESISASNMYFFTGIQSSWYWTCSGYTTSSPQKFMACQVPYTNPVGTAKTPDQLYHSMAVRGPLP